LIDEADHQTKPSSFKQIINQANQFLTAAWMKETNLKKGTIMNKERKKKNRL